MVVRIQLGSGTKVRQQRRKNQHVALALASLLTPGAVMACVLVLWRIAADLKAVAQFPISSGLFSHWQVWITLAGSLQFAATLLNRYGKSNPMLPNSVDEPSQELANSRY
jgi:hypothetical protein